MTGRIVHAPACPGVEVARCGWRRTSFLVSEPVPFSRAAGRVTCPECRALTKSRSAPAWVAAFNRKATS